MDSKITDLGALREFGGSLQDPECRDRQRVDIVTDLADISDAWRMERGRRHEESVHERTWLVILEGDDCGRNVCLPQLGCRPAIGVRLLSHDSPRVHGVFGEASTSILHGVAEFVQGTRVSPNVLHAVGATCTVRIDVE